MADTVARFRGLVLSASEIKQETGWSDAMTEDYLNILRSLITLANAVDAKNEIIKTTTKVATSPYELTATDEEVFFDTDGFGGDMVANLKPGIDGTNYRLINTGISGGFRVTINPFGTEKLFGVNSSEYIAMQEKLIITFDEDLGGWY